MQKGGMLLSNFSPLKGPINLMIMFVKIKLSYEFIARRKDKVSGFSFN